jgi:hypothetical protein
MTARRREPWRGEEGELEMVAKERICLTADRECVVPGDHVDARFLLVGEDCELEDKEAEEHGLRGGRLPRDWEKRHERWKAARNADERHDENGKED